MRNLSLIFISMLLPSIGLSQATAHVPAPAEKLYMLWGDFTRPRSLELVKSEIEKPVSGKSPYDVNILDFVSIITQKDKNPFAVTTDKPHTGDFYVDDYLPNPGDKKGPIPTVKDKDAAWFDDLVAQGELPKVFVIGGHQVISEGWHNDSESQFMFLPTLLKTLATHPNAKKVFESIKVAILFGCNTMTNLEPHSPDGHIMSPDEIKKMYFSGRAGKDYVLGAPDKNKYPASSYYMPINTLEFYRSRLAFEYGPAFEKEGHWEYTRGSKYEKCLGPGKYDHCMITNLDRILPDSGLWDGTHRYNYPYMMRRIFPNANIVIGFSSASPAEELRVKILTATFSDTYNEVNLKLGKTISNLLLPLLKDGYSPELKKQIITSLRKFWSKNTFRMNRQRVSGSISPVFPELENNSILGDPSMSNGSLQYGPYEPIEQAGPDAFMEAGDSALQNP